jgi:CubicO group peptidase (beta-lactamase class C family)
MTKLVVVVSILQQVEKGVLSLDNSAQVEKFAPELYKLPLLTGFDQSDQPTYTERKNPITLRQLLAHTAGLGYDFISPDVARWIQTTGAPGVWTNDAGVKGFEIPLIFEPGTKFCYSFATDWAGIILERATGLTLDEYFKKNIFGPLGITSISFLIGPELETKMQAMSGRDLVSNALMPSPGCRQQGTQIVQQSGGAGLVGTAKDYLRFLQGVLSGGSEKGSPIISKRSFDELFNTSLPPRGENNTCHENVTFFMAVLGFSDPAIVANQAFEHSVGFAFNTADSCFGRKAGTGAHLGAAKTYYWIDPTTGIAVS